MDATAMGTTSFAWVETPGRKCAAAAVVAAASVRWKRPPRNRSISQGASAIIQAETIMPTANRRETERATEVEKSCARFCWNNEAKKGSDAAPAAGPMTLKGALKSALA